MPSIVGGTSFFYFFQNKRVSLGYNDSTEEQVMRNMDRQYKFANLVIALNPRALGGGAG